MGDERKWLLVCSDCLAPVENVAFSNPAAAAYGALSHYKCRKCGRVVAPIEVDAQQLADLKKKVMKK